MPSIARALCLSAATWLTACSATPPSPSIVEVTVHPPATAEAAPPTPPSIWKIGAYLSLSGPEAAFGVDAKQGIQLAVDHVNARGGAGGRRIDVLWEDDKGDLRDTPSAVLRLVDDAQVVALLGDVTSARSKAGGIVANKRGVPMITPAATNPSVTQVGPFVFRACFDDAQQGKAAARYIVESLRKKRIGLLFGADDLYSQELAGAFRDEVKKRGAQIVVEQGLSRSETNPTAQVQAIARQKPDVVYVPVYFTQVPAIAKAAKAAGLEGHKLVGSDGWSETRILEDAGDLLEGAVFTDHWIADAPWPAARAFVTAHRQRFGREPSSIAALGHDAAALLADAIGRAEGSTREAVRKAIAETRGIEGATGTIAMGPDREPIKPVVIVRIEGRRFRYHATVRP